MPPLSSQANSANAAISATDAACPANSSLAALNFSENVALCRIIESGSVTSLAIFRLSESYPRLPASSKASSWTGH